MSTKKQFVELLSFLEKNKSSKVSDILSQVAEMCEAKKNHTTVIKDDNGKVTHIFCYYHKQWEDVSKVEYGKKASSATGLNTMCKVGVNKWTKQQSDAKNAKAELLDKVVSGEAKAENVKQQLDEIELKRVKIDMADAPKGTKEMPKK